MRSPSPSGHSAPLSPSTKPAAASVGIAAAPPDPPEAASIVTAVVACCSVAIHSIECNFAVPPETPVPKKRASTSDAVLPVESHVPSTIVGEASVPVTVPLHNADPTWVPFSYRYSASENHKSSLSGPSVVRAGMVGRVGIHRSVRHALDLVYGRTRVVAGYPEHPDHGRARCARCKRSRTRLAPGGLYPQNNRGATAARDEAAGVMSVQPLGSVTVRPLASMRT